MYSMRKAYRTGGRDKATTALWHRPGVASPARAPRIVGSPSLPQPASPAPDATETGPIPTE